MDMNCEMCDVQRKQKEVEKANNFYYQLLQKALPADEDATNDKPKGIYLHWKSEHWPIFVYLFWSIYYFECDQQCLKFCEWQ